MLLRKEFKFEAAHNLVRYHGKCERLHGHTYRLAVLLEGTPDDEGMIMDFCELSSIVKERVIAVLDHSYLNDTIPQPTAENIALWTWKRIEVPLQRPNCRLFGRHFGRHLVGGGRLGGSASGGKAAERGQTERRDHSVVRRALSLHTIICQSGRLKSR